MRPVSKDWDNVVKPAERLFDFELWHFGSFVNLGTYSVIDWSMALEFPVSDRKPASTKFAGRASGNWCNRRKLEFASISDRRAYLGYRSPERHSWNPALGWYSNSDFLGQKC